MFVVIFANAEVHSYHFMLFSITMILIMDVWNLLSGESSMHYRSYKEERNPK